MKYVVVCVSDQTSPHNFLNELHKIFTDNKVVVQSQKNNNFFVELVNYEMVNLDLMNLSSLFRIDIGLVPLDVFLTPKKLVVFDMDSTLITAEVIVEMAKKHGVGDKVKLITDRAMNGDLSFDQSLKERVALLKGFNRSHMEDILKNLSYTPGTPEFLTTLNRLGVKTAIASGGFEYFARHILSDLKMDYMFANDLNFENDELTGKIIGSIVNAEAKEQIVMSLAEKENLTLDQVVAIGDGANDIPMLLKAGLGIAIHAKEKVQKTARYRINFGPMTNALSFMNYEAV